MGIKTERDEVDEEVSSDEYLQEKYHYESNSIWNQRKQLWEVIHFLGYFLQSNGLPEK